MKQKVILVLFSVGVVLFFYNPIHKSSTEGDSIPIPENVGNLLQNQKVDLPATELSVPLSSRLKIPSLEINAAVEYVGLTSFGAMNVPKGPDNVGWFKLGPRPGEKGNAVLAGHSGFKDGKAAVFDNLHKLKKGDKIYFTNENGATTTFVVRELRSYVPTANAEDVFVSIDKKAHLNLITCEGIWNEVTKSRSERLVVFTDKVI